MAFTSEKRKYLVQAGLSEDAIKELESNIANKAQAAADAGLERKETTETQPATPPPAEQPAYVTATEVAAAVADVAKPITEALAAVAAQLAAMQAEVKALKESDEVKIAKAAAATPRASLQELIAANIIGQKEAQIDERTKLAKAGPKQQPAEAQITGVPFLDSLIQRSQGGAL